MLGLDPVGQHQLVLDDPRIVLLRETVGVLVDVVVAFIEQLVLDLQAAVCRVDNIQVQGVGDIVQPVIGVDQHAALIESADDRIDQRQCGGHVFGPDGGGSGGPKWIQR